MQEIEKTALWVAGMRALETERERPLFRDGFAHRLAGTDLVEQLREEAARVPVPPAIAVRTRWLDDEIADALDAGIRQVVFLAVGMDSRAYRLDWPAETHVFEVDYADILADKEAKLAGVTPKCVRYPLAIDLRDDWRGALSRAGFVPARPTLWIVEGLLCYLPESDVHRLLGDVGSVSATGTVLLMDVLGRSMLALDSAKVLHDLARQFCSDQPEDLVPAGWSATVSTMAEVGTALARWPFPVRPRGSAGVPHVYLVRATKC